MPEITVEIAQVAQSPASEAHIRQHTLLIDRPEAKGGTDQGAMGGELLLASLGGCFMSNLIAALSSRGLAAKDLRVKVAGTLEGTPPRFVRMVLNVSAGGLEKEQMEKLVVMAERACIVANTLRDSVQIEAVYTH